MSEWRETEVERLRARKPGELADALGAMRIALGKERPQDWSHPWIHRMIDAANRVLAAPVPRAMTEREEAWCAQAGPGIAKLLNEAGQVTVAATCLRLVEERRTPQRVEGKQGD